MPGRSRGTAHEMVLLAAISTCWLRGEQGVVIISIDVIKI
jgi:hypothetical protein